jgi:hypothetical protein
MSGGTPNTPDRVTTREFYDALLKQNERMDLMERRILAQLELLPRLEQKTWANKESIDELRSRSDRLDTITTLVTLLAAAVAGWFGVRDG